MPVTTTGRPRLSGLFTRLRASLTSPEGSSTTIILLRFLSVIEGAITIVALDSNGGPTLTVVVEGSPPKRYPNTFMFFSPMCPFASAIVRAPVGIFNPALKFIVLHALVVSTSTLNTDAVVRLELCERRIVTICPASRDFSSSRVSLPPVPYTIENGSAETYAYFVWL